MKTFPPFLFRWSLVLLAASAPGRAQTVQLPRFTVTASAVGTQQAPELFWLDLQIRPDGTEVRTHQPLSIPIGRRGAPARLPLRPPYQLFRKVEGGGSQYQPVVSLPRPEDESRFLVIFYRASDGTGSVNILDDSTRSHPPGTVRVVNQTPGRCAVSIGGGSFMIPGGEDRLLGAPPEGRFPFEFAASITGGPNYVPPVKRLRFPTSQHRLLVVFSHFPLFDVNERGQSILTGYQPRAYRMYDRVEAEEPGEETEE